MNGSRRVFCMSAAPALLAALARKAEAEPLQPLPSFTKRFADLPVHAGAAAAIRPIAEGRLADGGQMEIHETTLNAGAEPHPPHRHKHEELLLLMSGTVEVTIDGATTTLTPGSVGFWQSMALHHLRNPGPEPAQYFIVALGAES